MAAARYVATYASPVNQTSNSSLASRFTAVSSKLYPVGSTWTTARLCSNAASKTPNESSLLECADTTVLAVPRGVSDRVYSAARSPSCR